MSVNALSSTPHWLTRENVSQVLALNNLRISKLPGEVGGKTGTATSQVAALTVCLRPEKTSKGLCLKC